MCQVYVGMCTGTHACGDWCWMCPLIALCPLAERLGFSDSRFHILLLCTLVTGGPPCPPECHVYVGVCTRGNWSPEESVGFSGTGVTGDCDQPDVGAVN